MGHLAASSRARSGVGKTWRRAGRDAVVASASAAVLAFLVFFAVAAPTGELTASVGPVVPRPGTTATVEGRVLGPTGDGLEGAEIVVRRTGMRPVRTVADPSGAFRVALRGDCATFTVSLRAEARGDTMRTSARRHLCPGDSLPVDARVVMQGHFLWIPGPR